MDSVTQDRGTAGVIMDGLWPLLGGDMTPAEDWHEISAVVSAALATGLAEREAERAEMARLREENAKLQEEIDERDEWLQLVDTLPLDGFDKLGDYWVQRLAVVQMSQALASVFTKYAPESIMARFRDAMRNIMHQSFVEGCIVGVRTERTNPNRATFSGSP